MSDKFQEYRGMSYQQASIEAERLILRGGWFHNFERLQALRFVMLHHMASSRSVRKRYVGYDGARYA